MARGHKAGMAFILVTVQGALVQPFIKRFGEMSLTSIFAPLIFAAGLFSYFTSPAAPFGLPSAPFLVGSVLPAVSFPVLLRLFRRMPPG